MGNRSENTRPCKIFLATNWYYYAQWEDVKCHYIKYLCVKNLVVVVNYLLQVQMWISLTELCHPIFITSSQYFQMFIHPFIQVFCRRLDKINNLVMSWNYNTFLYYYLLVTYSSVYTNLHFLLIFITSSHGVIIINVPYYKLSKDL